MVTIDGLFGEGGGQILRTSLALSLVTGKPFSIHNIRAARKKPGLMRQHLRAVNAAAEIGQAAIEGHRIVLLERGNIIHKTARLLWPIYRSRSQTGNSKLFVKRLNGAENC